MHQPPVAVIFNPKLSSSARSFVDWRRFVAAVRTNGPTVMESTVAIFPVAPHALFQLWLEWLPLLSHVLPFREFFQVVPLQFMNALLACLGDSVNCDTPSTGVKSPLASCMLSCNLGVDNSSEGIIKWQLRLKYFTYETLQDLRIAKLSEIIGGCLESYPAIVDLKQCLEYSGQHSKPDESFISALKYHLLIAGASVVRTAERLPEPALRCGDSIYLVGLSRNLQATSSKSIVTNPCAALNISSVDCPRYKAMDIGVIEVDTDFDSILSGVLTDEQGRVQAIWESLSALLKCGYSSSKDHLIIGPPTCKFLEFLGSMIEGQRLTFVASYNIGERGDCFYEWLGIKGNGVKEGLSTEESLNLTLDDVGSRIELVYSPICKDGVEVLFAILSSSRDEMPLFLEGEFCAVAGLAKLNHENMEKLLAIVERILHFQNAGF